MEIRVVKKSKQISKDELKIIAKEQFGDLVKAVVDTEQEIMAVGDYHHEDEREFLIKNEGSKFENLWGIDLFPEKPGDYFIEIDSIINLRPSFKSRGVFDQKTQKKILDVTKSLISDFNK